LPKQASLEKNMNRFLIALFATLALGACTPDGPAERAGERLDDAADNIGDAARDVGDEVEDFADDVSDGVQ
jgi:hypothetical protein